MDKPEASETTATRSAAEEKQTYREFRVEIKGTRLGIPIDNLDRLWVIAPKAGGKPFVAGVTISGLPVYIHAAEVVDVAENLASINDEISARRRRGGKPSEDQEAEKADFEQQFTAKLASHPLLVVLKGKEELVSNSWVTKSMTVNLNDTVIKDPRLVLRLQRIWLGERSLRQLRVVAVDDLTATVSGGRKGLLFVLPRPERGEILFLAASAVKSEGEEDKIESRETMRQNFLFYLGDRLAGGGLIHVEAAEDFPRPVVEELRFPPQLQRRENGNGSYTEPLATSLGEKLVAAQEAAAITAPVEPIAGETTVPPANPEKTVGRRQKGAK